MPDDYAKLAQDAQSRAAPVDDQEGYDTDANGNVIHTGPTPPTPPWISRPADRMAYEADKLPKLTPEQQAAFESKLANVRQAVNGVANNQYQKTLRYSIEQPGGMAAAGAGLKAGAATKEAIQKVYNAVMPQQRQPVQMGREFPSTPQGEADKQAYINDQLVRRAAVEAAKKASEK